MRGHPKTNAPYYKAFVRIDQSELAGIPTIRRCPGMPAIVLLATAHRAAFESTVGPLACHSINHSDTSDV
ncbi:hypothetical protein XI00_03900 [Bradyrhizobium sp. CCBAU 21359]|nr:hypothetical protein [Bradyrhizobium sp. CCBAU 21359]